MDKETFIYLCNNQRKWADEYRTQQSIRKEIRKITNRKYKSRSGDELRANIINDLKASLYADEITITENHEGKGFDVRWRGECYSLPLSNTQERM